MVKKKSKKVHSSKQKRKSPIVEVSKKNTQVKELVVKDISRKPGKNRVVKEEVAKEELAKEEVAKKEQAEISDAKIDTADTNKAEIVGATEKADATKVQIDEVIDKAVDIADTSRGEVDDKDVDKIGSSMAKADEEADKDADKADTSIAEADGKADKDADTTVTSMAEVGEEADTNKTNTSNVETLEATNGVNENEAETNATDVAKSDTDKTKGDSLVKKGIGILKKSKDVIKKVRVATVMMILGVIVAIACVAAYISISMFFEDVFFDNTFINGYDFSRTAPSEFMQIIDRDANSYVLKVVDNGGVSEIITGPEVGFTLSDNNKVADIFEQQNPWAWPTMMFREANHVIEFEISYCDALISERVAELVFTNNQVMAEPVDAKIDFDGERFFVQEEVMGALVNERIFTHHVRDAISVGASSINVDDFDVRIRPNITSDKQEMIDAVNQLNNYLSARITYDLNPKQVVVDDQQIIDWISYDDDFVVTFHEYRAREFMSEFIATYSTYGTVRTFTNPLGREAQVSSWGFGWSLDEETEVEAFLADIRNGEVAYREPAHFQRGTFYETGEWGDTYIQIDLSSQHMWYFVNGELVLESPIVTGMAGRSQTPAGIFYIQIMLSPTILRGPWDPEEEEYEWESPVSYWMQITWSGIGLHDATWQPYFGGRRWTYGGSRGCINLPLDRAGQLYRMVAHGTRVIIHY